MTFIQKAIAQGIAILFGASGEIVTEKSGNLNLGIPGIMYMGGIAGLMGAFFYEHSQTTPNGVIGALIAVICALVASALGGLIYSFLTITLRANQNVVGLALTTFGIGFRTDFRYDNRCCLSEADSGAFRDSGDRTVIVLLWISDLHGNHYLTGTGICSEEDQGRIKSPGSR